MPKNLIACIDGTWNTGVSSVAPPTNVYSLFVSIAQPNQVKFYFPGVGTRRDWLGRRLEGAMGKGVFHTAREAWGQIAANFQIGDKIFIFGFSRGAYAARHLASMIVRRGLRGWQGTLEDEFRSWQAEVRSAPGNMVREKVHFLGLFDCVPGNQLYLIRDRSGHLNKGVLENGIVHLRHAVSTHERRWSFRPILFEANQQQSFDQRWFPGFHSDVGGGTRIATGLASFSQWWMMREAFGVGLDFENIDCPQHLYGHTLGVIRSVDPRDTPVPSDYWTTRLGLTWDRTARQSENSPKETPRFEDLDTCPRCGNAMFDYFLTDVGQRWLRSKGLVR